MMKRLGDTQEQRYIDWQWNLRNPERIYAGVPAKREYPRQVWRIYRRLGTSHRAAAVTIAIIDTGLSIKAT